MTSSRYLLFPLVACAVSATAQAQTTGTITGRVTNRNGGAVEAVSVGLQGQAKGDITDEQGRFRIRQVAPGQYTLVVSAVGLKTEQQTVTVVAGQAATVNLALAESAAELKEVVVNGNRTNKFNRPSSVDVAKMPLKNLENPQVYATVGKELLTEQLVFSVDDATRNVPGLQKMWDATGRGGDGGAFYASRGFVVSSQLRNGVAGNVTSTIDAVNLEKLEVIKGPSSTLYGGALTTYGGLLNRVTKKPTSTFGGEVNVAGGSYGFHRGSFDVNTPLNAAKTLAFRLNAAYQYEDGWQNHGYPGFARTVAIAPSLQFQPNDRLTINLDAEIFRGRNTVQQLVYFVYGDPIRNLGFSRADETPLDYRQSYIGPGLQQDSRSTNFFGQVQYRLSPSFTSTTYLTASRSFSEGYGPYFYLASNATTSGSTNATPGASTLQRADQSTQNSHTQTYEVQQLFNGDFQLGSLRNRVVLGLDYLHIGSNLAFLGGIIDQVPVRAISPGYPTGYDYTNFTNGAINAAYAASPPSRYPVTTKVNTYSAFASDVLNLTERLSVLAALRIDRYANSGGLVYFPVDSYAQTTLSPKFGVVYQPIKDRVALFANYQNSFRNQNTTYLTAQGQSFATRPERANQAEAGVKIDAAEGRVSATVSYYDIRVRNILRTVGVNAAGVGISSQDGNQWSRGAEFNLTANPLPGLNLVGGFAYNYSVAVDTDSDFNGRRPETASSPYLANAWVSYRQPSGALRGLGAGVGGNYASDNKIVNRASLGEFTLPSYTVLNASIFYDQPKYRISAKVDNLTDTQYWIGYTTLSPQKLRNIVGSVAYKF